MNTARIARARATVSAPNLSISRELELVEARLEEQIASREPRLTEISRYLIDSGGKRVRPAVALLTYRACGGAEARLADIVDVAVALELIHSASLLHDDIIDASDVRRGRDSALRKFGLATTLVAGDFLFGLAYQLCARFEERLIRWAVDACIELTEGEIMQGRLRRNPEVTLADYIEIVSRKTASLFAAGARTAAYLADAGEAKIAALATAGTHVGITFQMVDDILDVIGEEDQMGKPVCMDLRDGNPSLPVVLLLADDPTTRPLFQKPELTPSELETLLSRLQQPAILSEARRMAAAHAEEARRALHEIPVSSYRDHLLRLIDQLLDRVS